MAENAALDLRTIVGFASTPAGPVVNNALVAAAVAVPDAIDLSLPTPVAGPVARTISWSLRWGSGQPVQSASYRLVAGGFDQPNLAFVVVPYPRQRILTLRVEVSLGVAGMESEPFTREVTYTIAALDPDAPALNFDTIVGFASTPAGTVVNGALVAAAVAVPDAIDLSLPTPVAGPVARTIAWSVAEGGVPADPASYCVVSGGFDRPSLALVFVPSATERIVTLGVTVSLGVAGVVGEPFTKDVTYAIAALDAQALTARASSVLNDLVRPTASAFSLPVGLVTLGLGALTSPEPVGTVLEVTRAAPKVDVRAEIALGEVIGALLQPLAVIGAALDTVTGGVAGATTDATEFVANALTVPVVLTRRATDVVRRMLPDVTVPQPAVDLDPVAPSVTVPVGAWAPVLPIDKVEWHFDPNDRIVPVPLAAGVPDTGLVQRVLVLPEFAGATTIVAAKVAVTLTLPNGAAETIELAQQLALTLSVVPLSPFAVALNWNQVASAAGPKRYSLVVPKDSPLDASNLMSELTSLEAVLATATNAIGVARAAGAHVPVGAAKGAGAVANVGVLATVVASLRALLGGELDVPAHRYEMSDWTPKEKAPDNVKWVGARIDDPSAAFPVEWMVNTIYAAYFVAPGYTWVGLATPGDTWPTPFVWQTRGLIAWAMFNTSTSNTPFQFIPQTPAKAQLGFDRTSTSNLADIDGLVFGVSDLAATSA